VNNNAFNSRSQRKNDNQENELGDVPSMFLRTPKGKNPNGISNILDSYFANSGNKTLSMSPFFLKK
jgi:hypothetical protein